jgi:hypothetical protein
MNKLLSSYYVYYISIYGDCQQLIIFTKIYGNRHAATETLLLVNCRLTAIIGTTVTFYLEKDAKRCKKMQKDAKRCRAEALHPKNIGGRAPNSPL